MLAPCSSSSFVIFHSAGETPHGQSCGRQAEESKPSAHENQFRGEGNPSPASPRDRAPRRHPEGSLHSALGRGAEEVEGRGPALPGLDRAPPGARSAGRRTLLMAARTGHLGPTVFRSTDWGKTWKEAAEPPAFPKVPKARRGASWNTCSGSRPGTRASPACGMRARPRRGSSARPTAARPGTASSGSTIIRCRRNGSARRGRHPRRSEAALDPRRSPRSAHLYLGMSGGGIFESTDGGSRGTR